MYLFDLKQKQTIKEIHIDFKIMNIINIVINKPSFNYLTLVLSNNDLYLVDLDN